MSQGLSHAVAVRQAILAAQRDNQRWMQAEQQQTATTGSPCAGAPVGAPAPPPPPPPNGTDSYHNDTRIGGDIRKPTKAVFTEVSSNDVLLGLRIGNKLIILDDQQNKYATIVQAVDGLLQKAKKLADADPTQPVVVKTTVDGKSSVMLEATPTQKGFATKLYYIDGTRKQPIEPIGVVRFTPPTPNPQPQPQPPTPLPIRSIGFSVEVGRCRQP